jgi:hypothetical protein
VKARHLFLLKFLGYSLVLYVFGHQLLHGYAALLGQGMVLLNQDYHVPPNIEYFLYGSSMTIIAFIALMLATPGNSGRKKASVIGIGLIAFFLTDSLFIQYVIFPAGQPRSNEDSPVFEMYLCIKWLLPFLLWLIVSHPYLGELLRRGKEDRSTS